ncbi:MAG TPA: plasmid pRiA4b ORF-3 family protein [Terriglobia bacterium]|nr:plasmid pRiA4b ORF-3 family protein [Terriglobia bacterium]
MPVKTKPRMYQLKVTLDEIRPPIWRRFLVRSNVTLYRLHLFLQVVMGWTDSHLHLFTIDGLDYGEPDPDYKVFGHEVMDDRKTKLEQVVGREGMKFSYQYDFGDGWEHTVEVEKILPPQTSARSACLEGARACPPEDCGGVGGYEELVEAMAKPRSKKYKELVEWLGEEFQPEAFDLEIVNLELADIR